MKIDRVLTLGDFLRYPFQVTYPADGVDEIRDTIDGKPDLYRSERGRKHRRNSTIMITSFLGLPNRNVDVEATRARQWLQILINFFGADTNGNLAKRIFFAFLISFVNIIATPLKLSMNIIKLATEVVPSYIVDGLHFLAKRLEIRSQNSPTLRGKLGFIVLAGFAGLFAGILTPVRFLLRAASNPFESARGMWVDGEVYAARNFPRSRIARNLFRGLFTTVSILGTAVMWGIALPLAVKAFATNVAPILIERFPNVSASVGDFLVAAITKTGPVLSFIGKAITPVSFVTNAFGLSSIFNVVTSMPAITGLGVVSATFMGTVGTGLSRLNEKFKSWWFNNHTDKVVRANNGNAAHQQEAENPLLPQPTAPERTPSPTPEAKRLAAEVAAQQRARETEEAAARQRETEEAAAKQRATEEAAAKQRATEEAAAKQNAEAAPRTERDPSSPSRAPTISTSSSSMFAFAPPVPGSVVVTEEEVYDMTTLPMPSTRSAPGSANNSGT